MPDRHRSIGLDEALWAHPLFANPARYPCAAHTLAAARIDEHIRRNRRMPSTSDQSAPDAIAAAEAVYDTTRKTLLGLQADPATPLGANLELLRRTHSLARTFETRQIGPLEIRLLDRLLPDLARDGLLLREVRPDDTLAAVHQILVAAERMLLDRLARRIDFLRKRYLRNMYEAMNHALDYNVTSDAARIAPVLGWMAQRGSTAGRAYVDVGCSMPTGARNTLLAARALRPAGFSLIHGVDIVAPGRELQRQMARDEHILLYQADPVHHPLPRRYDAILLANVHRHLTRPDQERMLRHLAASLAPAGNLYLNWRFDAENSPALRLCLHGGCLAIAEERNCARFTAA